jgi:hypothetical protein
MSATGTNSWSELLTLRAWKFLRVDAGEKSQFSINGAILHRIVSCNVPWWILQSHSPGVPTMSFAPHPFIASLRSLLAFLAASVRKLLKIEPHAGDFASQRICPFCGLITPRHEASCLECGGAFKAA